MILVRVFFSLLILGPFALGVVNLIKNKNAVAPKSANYQIALLNSAVLYAIAYNIIFFLQELFLVIGKKAIGLKAYLYHNNHRWDGEHPTASLMQGSGAAAIFIIGLVCFLWLRAMRNSTSIWKLLVLWLAYQGLLQSIPQVMVAYFDPKTDVGQALFGYLGLSQPLMATFSIVSIIAIAVVSVWFARPLLELAPRNTKLDNPKSRLTYIRFIGFGAAVLGYILIVPFRIPPVSQIIAPLLLLLFSIPWTWAAAANMKNIWSMPNQVNEKIHWQPVALLVGLLLIFRFILAPGIEF